MPRPPESNSCERVLGLLDARPEGELSAEELLFLDRHTTACPSCAVERDLAAELARGLARLPRYSCPAAVTARVLDMAQRSTSPRLSRWEQLRFAARALPGALWEDLTLPGLWRPLVAAGAAALVAAVLVTSGLVTPGGTASPPAYTPEEVAKAKADLELALAYLGRMGQETGTRVEREVVDHLIAPAFRAMAPAGTTTPERR